MCDIEQLSWKFPDDMFKNQDYDDDDDDDKKINCFEFGMVLFQGTF